MNCKKTKLSQKLTKKIRNDQKNDHSNLRHFKECILIEYNGGWNKWVLDNEIRYQYTDRKLKKNKLSKENLPGINEQNFEEMVIELSEINKWKFFHSFKFYNAGVNVTYKKLENSGKFKFIAYIQSYMPHRLIGVCVVNELISLMNKKKITNMAIFADRSFTQEACKVLEQHKSMLEYFKTNWLNTK